MMARRVTIADLVPMVILESFHVHVMCTSVGAMNFN